MVDIFVCQLPAKRNRSALHVLLANVQGEKQKRIQQFFHLDDAYRTLIGDFLIRSIFYKRTEKPMGNTIVEKNACGKPFFPEYPFIQYNISHSGNFVVCAVHDQPVGIDIEKVQSFDLQMAQQLFTETEYRNIFHAKNRDLACYDIWTIKESYVKALGKGLAIPLNSFQVNKLNRDKIEFTDMQTGKWIKNIICKQYRIDEAYKLSICAQGAGISDFIENPHYVSFDSLCNEISMQCNPSNASLREI